MAGKLKTLYLESEEVEKRVVEMQEANPGITLKAAVKAVYDSLLKENADLLGRISELEAAGSQSGESKEVAELQKQLEARETDITRLTQELATAQEAFESARLEAGAADGQFADLGTIAPEAAEYLKTVRNEVLAAGIHPTTANWLLNMLHIMQSLPGGAAGYIPSSGETVKTEWL